MIHVFPYERIQFGALPFWPAWSVYEDASLLSEAVSESQGKERRTEAGF
jgi:hypothetical protein